MKTYKLPISKDTCNYLQRLAYEIETKKSIVTRLIENSSSDLNTGVLESPVFVSYHKMLEDAVAAYEIAKAEFQEQLKPVVYAKEGKECDFNWFIPNFNNAEVEISVKACSCNCDGGCKEE